VKAAFEDWEVSPPEGAPEGAPALAPPNLASIATVLAWASEHGNTVLPWGGGSHMGPAQAPADVVLLTRELTGIVDWQPDDLTLVVEAGTPLAVVEELLAERRQSAVLTEQPDGATIGGVIAAGASGYRRLRYGPTRDRVLEVVMASGDGRVFTSGGRVVKNVTGYDIPRLACGSMGALGVIGRVCLKLWPMPESTASVTMAVADFPKLYRPLALLETEKGAVAYLAGTAEEVAAQASDVGGDPRPGLQWPEPLQGPVEIELRIPPPLVGSAVERVQRAGSTSFRAQHGVGIVAAAFTDWSDDRLAELRTWAEANRGAAVVQAATVVEVDRWGTPPDSLQLQHRVKAAFDPRRVMAPGRLPGGV